MYGFTAPKALSHPNITVSQVSTVSKSSPIKDRAHQTLMNQFVRLLLLCLQPRQELLNLGFRHILVRLDLLCAVFQWNKQLSMIYKSRIQNNQKLYRPERVGRKIIKHTAPTPWMRFLSSWFVPCAEKWIGSFFMRSNACPPTACPWARSVLMTFNLCFLWGGDGAQNQRDKVFQESKPTCNPPERIQNRKK